MKSQWSFGVCRANTKKLLNITRFTLFSLGVALLYRVFHCVMQSVGMRLLERSSKYVRSQPCASVLAEHDQTIAVYSQHRVGAGYTALLVAERVFTEKADARTKNETTKQTRGRKPGRNGQKRSSER